MDIVLDWADLYLQKNNNPRSTPVWTVLNQIVNLISGVVLHYCSVSAWPEFTSQDKIIHGAEN